MKKCTKCKETKESNDFGFRDKRKGYLKYMCKACEKTYRGLYYIKNKSKERQKSKEWIRDNPERVKINKRKYYLKYLTQNRLYQREYARVNFKDHRKRTLKWKEDNKERTKAHYMNHSAIKRGAKVCKCCTKEEITQHLMNRPDGYHADHIIPISQGGEHCTKNLQFLSVEDHKVKSIKEIKERKKCSKVGTSKLI